jgi:hypothetical protein
VKINGEVKQIDLLKENNEGIANLSKDFDITFLFKALDSLESIKRNSSRELLKSLESKFIVVSFATKSIGGNKEIKKSKRNWFTKAIAQFGFKVSTFEIPGEMFYVLGK